VFSPPWGKPARGQYRVGYPPEFSASSGKPTSRLALTGGAVLLCKLPRAVLRLRLALGRGGTPIRRERRTGDNGASRRRGPPILHPAVGGSPAVPSPSPAGRFAFRGLEVSGSTPRSVQPWAAGGLSHPQGAAGGRRPSSSHPQTGSSARTHPAAGVSPALYSPNPALLCPEKHDHNGG
jgi:hypothetical protein